MYLLYLDESGTLKDPTEEHYVLAGVSVFERQIYWVDKALRELAEAYAIKLQVAVTDLEFHASEIRRGKSFHGNA